ncbi:antibiotic biosynthesis monooxygenase [Caldibacillus lycopersici]|uniref:Antibiotic biosynthesis monooxygenase n=1 Tax=Perspicuibacillus lycopersici TaxID=1325689 RepID=A0AAE3IQK9_9BACI|nr:putative quinol monooxygenase [Perspicuibacillus lycopersici]MCU9612607.1 antibiotic biosynthesis monooxygenase [Perspicuibacillus lycopersici]
MSKFGLFGKFTVKEGERDTFEKILLKAAESLQNIEACELYLVNRSDEDENAVFVYEVWSNQDAHQASLALDSTQEMIQRARPIITGMERIATFQSCAGKGV